MAMKLKHNHLAVLSNVAEHILDGDKRQKMEEKVDECYVLLYMLLAVV